MFILEQYAAREWAITLKLIWWSPELLPVKDILLIATLLDWCQAASVNHYCNTDLCLNSQLRPRKHVACFDDIEDNILHDSEAFTSNCPKDRRMMYMNNELKERLLDVHNELRNKVALGELEGYAPASKMGRLVSIQKYEIKWSIISSKAIKMLKFICFRWITNLGMGWWVSIFSGIQR